MKTISIYEAPVVISGLLSKYQKGHLWKAPEEIFGKVSEWVDIMRVRSTGGRVRFRTDTKKLWIRTTLKACTPDVNFPIVGSAACDVLRGRGMEADYVGFVVPPEFGKVVGEREISLPGTMEDIAIYMPRNEEVEDIEIAIDDDAEILPPTPYTFEDPILYYGSSVTEGLSLIHI